MSIFGRKSNVITYTVNKAVNTSMYITVQNGEVVVNAPWYFTANKIQQIVQEKKNWILSKMQECDENLSNMQSVKIFGKNYDIQVNYEKIKNPELNLKENYKIQIILPIKYRKVGNEQVLKMTIEKMYEQIAENEIEDIMEKMIETNYTNITANYGKQFTPTNKYYPSILLKEKGQNVNGIVGTELNESEQKELINQTTKPQATSLEVKYTYWCKTMTISDFKNSKYYELFINNGSNYSTYWMSSRCIDYPSGGARFNISRVHSGDVRASSLYNTNGAEYSDVNAFRPVVTLNSNVQIISGNGSTDSPFNIQ